METQVNNWNSNNISLDTSVKEFSTITFQFEALKDLDIETIIPSCGCMSTYYDTNKKVLISSFNVGSIPKHLVNQGFYIAHKNIKVIYKDGSEELLSFNCKVEK